MNAGRRGFSLVEMLIVAVLGSLIVLASLQVLVTNQRAYTGQTHKIRGQQTSRAGMEILTGEIREVSAQGGDILAMGPDSLTIRTMRKFGVVCAVSTANPPQLTAIRVGDWFAVDDSVFVFADNNTSRSSDDAWIPVRVTAVDTTQTCAGRSAQRLSFAGQSAPFTADSVRTGAPMRSYTRYTYGLYDIDGTPYLGRRTTGTPVPMVGPVRTSDGVAFAFFDGNGAVTANMTDVRQIDVTLRTPPGAMSATDHTPISDSITARVFTRN
ncbi:MAG: prepilin-type N-terminal cleavage/methylation domain-containing protein [Longimicrobiales bacterium]